MAHHVEDDDDDDDDGHDAILQDDQVAYVFQPAGVPEHQGPRAARGGGARAKKRRRTTTTTTSKRGAKAAEEEEASSPEPEAEDGEGHGAAAAAAAATPATAEDPAPFFVPLFDGAERPAGVRARVDAYRRCWARVGGAADRVLEEANSETLAQVSAFVDGAAAGEGGQEEKEGNGGGGLEGRIPTAFINTGPDVSSQDLLFGNLARALHKHGDGGGGGGATSRVVRLRAADAAASFKAILKRVIRGAVGDGADADGDEEDEAAPRAVGGEKYLDYDLEALAASARLRGLRHVFVAFQDSEMFDGGMLSDLIHLFSTWRKEIPFVLLFGISTSVEMLQARLLKSTVPLLLGAQFDVARPAAVVQRLVKRAVAAADVELRLGPGLLRALLRRQRDQIAGVQAFVSALRYAHMCFFYANPLSALCVARGRGGVSGGVDVGVDVDPAVQREHVDAARTLGSFRAHVERHVASGWLDVAQGLLTQDRAVREAISGARAARTAWVESLLRSLLLLGAVQAHDDFSEAYLWAMEGGVDADADDALVREPVRKMAPDTLLGVLDRVAGVVEAGDPDLGLEGWARPGEALLRAVRGLRERLAALRDDAEENDHELRSRYTSSGVRMRATVVAQKVQLTHHEATLTERDRAFTQIIDDTVAALVPAVRCDGLGDGVFLHEAWAYDSLAPARDVLVPRPRAAVERALRRPWAYLGCACCSPGAGGKKGDAAAGGGGGGGTAVAPTLPPTALLYRLYTEAGSLINVADLWSAFWGVVGGEGEGEGEDGDGGRGAQGGKGEGRLDRTTALVRFYQALAELKQLGFVKGTKRKVDHVARVKWL